MLSELLLAVGLGLILYAFYKWATLHNDYFVKRNLPFMKPVFLLGTNGGFFFGKYTPPEFTEMIYNWFPNDKMCGLFQFRKPMLLVRDPDLLKQMAAKDFEHFEDHAVFGDESAEDVFANGLFLMRGQRWRDMRNTLSPAFTGSKMRQMFELLTECADDMTKYLAKQSAGGVKIDPEMKDLLSRYTNDCIASCAFGIRVNSFEDPDNEFIVNGKKSLDFSGALAMLKMLFVSTLPTLAKKLNIQLFPPSIDQFFTSVVIGTMEERAKRGIFRPDVINLLMEVRQGKVEETTAEQTVEDGFATVEESRSEGKGLNRQWKDYELVSQCFIFFVAGYDSIANMLVFLTYELSIYPDIQQKLYDEICETEENLKGKRIDYNTLQKMKYMDQVVSEGLRKWPVNAIIDRLCVKDYLCAYGDNRQFLIEKGVVFWIPVYAIHHDSKYYPNPERFDPDRFSDENKHKIVSGTYLPFGLGPRNCIGSRFALMELKVLLYFMLLNFSLVPNAKTEIPLKLKKTAFQMQPENGLSIDLIPRTQRKQ